MADRTDAEEAREAREDSVFRILAGAWGAMVRDLIRGETDVEERDGRVPDPVRDVVGHDRTPEMGTDGCETR